MFKVGDKALINCPDKSYHGQIGTIEKIIFDNCFYRVSLGKEKILIGIKLLERVDNMDLSERLSEVIKENQNLKQQISEQNIKLNKIKADINREFRHKRGASDEEFREAFVYWKNHSNSVCMGIWDGEYELRDIFNSFSLSEFVSKYKEYKDNQNEIKVGDEIYYTDPNYLYIVTNIDREGNAVVMSQFGKFGTESVEKLHKTGKHYDIESILNGLKESD